MADSPGLSGGFKTAPLTRCVIANLAATMQGMDAMGLAARKNLFDAKMAASVTPEGIAINQNALACKAELAT